MSTLTIHTDQPEIMDKVRAFLETIPGITFESDEPEETIDEWLAKRPLNKADLDLAIEQDKNGEGIIMTMEELAQMIATHEKR